MGAEPCYYFVPYRQDVAAALDRFASANPRRVATTRLCRSLRAAFLLVPSRQRR